MRFIMTKLDGGKFSHVSQGALRLVQPARDHCRLIRAVSK